MTDPTADQTQASDSPRPMAERRWPMAVAVLAIAFFQVITPRQGRLSGWWVFPVLEVVMLGVLIARDPGRIDRRSKGLRRQTFVLIGFMTAGTVGSALVLVIQILGSSTKLTPDTLLGRGGMAWITNIIIFSLWFWEIDRGGPAERAAGSSIRASFAFPEDTVPHLAPPGWAPRYPDYLYLAFTNATAFSPTDAVPVRTWAKMAMMTEATVSFVIAILVVARAVNLLPG
jgi:uncharacterized membrane protein